MTLQRAWTPWHRYHESINVCCWLSVVAFSLLFIAGCGKDTGRLKISGEVTFDGAPLDGGSIRFTLIESETTLASGAMIRNGKYNIPKEKGLLPGTYHLEISAPDTNGPTTMARAAPGGPGIPVAVERIPPEYNIDSDKTIEVTIDGDNHFVFEIVSESAK